MLFQHRLSFPKQKIIVLSLCLLCVCFLNIADKVAFAKNDNIRNTPHKVFALGAANGRTNWTLVEEFSKNNGSWSIAFANLPGFGNIMKQRGFQAALDKFHDKVVLAIQKLDPAVILVASKGLGIVTHLAHQGIYSGAVVLLSPIPNECNHVSGTTWEEQWTDSMSVLVNNGVEPIGVGVGTSLDEQTLIVDLMNETQVCGDLVEKSADDMADDDDKGKLAFERCPNWFVRSFPGDHGWKNDASNAVEIASLIDEVLAIDKRLNDNDSAPKEL